MRAAAWSSGSGPAATDLQCRAGAHPPPKSPRTPRRRRTRRDGRRARTLARPALHWLVDHPAPPCRGRCGFRRRDGGLRSARCAGAGFRGRNARRGLWPPIGASSMPTPPRSLRSLDARSASRTDLLDSLGQEEGALAQERAALDAAWAALWSGSSITPQDPDAMIEWLRTRSDILDLNARLATAERHTQLSQQRAD